MNLKVRTKSKPTNWQNLRFNRKKKKRRFASKCKYFIFDTANLPKINKIEELRSKPPRNKDTQCVYTESLKGFAVAKMHNEKAYCKVNTELCGEVAGKACLSERGVRLNLHLNRIENRSFLVVLGTDLEAPHKFASFHILEEIQTLYIYWLFHQFRFSQHVGATGLIVLTAYLLQNKYNMCTRYIGGVDFNHQFQSLI